MMQMCVVKDRSLTKQLLDRAQGWFTLRSAFFRMGFTHVPKIIGAGYKALFLSVDVPVLGRRLNEYRNEFTLPDELNFPNILSSGLKEFAEGENSHDYGTSRRSVRAAVGCEY